MKKNQPTAWVGWVFFASAMMILVGGLQTISGLAALFKDGFYVVSAERLIAFDYSTWGWVNLIIGLLIVAAGLAIMSGQTWGRVVGVFLAVLSALSNLAFISAYPLWSIVALVIDCLVIYALTMHGAEVND